MGAALLWEHAIAAVVATREQLSLSIHICKYAYASSERIEYVAVAAFHFRRYPAAVHCPQALWVMTGKSSARLAKKGHDHSSQRPSSQYLEHHTSYRPHGSSDRVQTEAVLASDSVTSSQPGANPCTPFSDSRCSNEDIAMSWLRMVCNVTLYVAFTCMSPPLTPKVLNADRKASTSPYSQSKGPGAKNCGSFTNNVCDTLWATQRSGELFDKLVSKTFIAQSC